MQCCPRSYDRRPAEFVRPRPFFCLLLRSFFQWTSFFNRLTSLARRRRYHGLLSHSLIQRSVGSSLFCNRSNRTPVGKFIAPGLYLRSARPPAPMISRRTRLFIVRIFVTNGKNLSTGHDHRLEPHLLASPIPIDPGKTTFITLNHSRELVHVRTL